MALSELTAVFLHERVRFQNPNGDVIIGSARPIDAEDQIGIKGPSENGDLEPRLTYRFWGRWTEYTHKRTNEKEKQFAFQSFVEVQPHGERGVTAYLMQLKGIGLKAASRMWAAYGSEAVNTLRERPDLVAEEITGISSKVANAASCVLLDKYALEGCSIELIELFDGRGFPKDTAKRAIKEWGNEAPRLIKKNPYLLMHFRGCGFGRCDALYLDLGHPPAALKRQALCAWNAIARDRNGHTWHMGAFVKDQLHQQIGGTDVKADQAVRLATRSGMLSARWATVNDELDWDGDTCWLAESSKARAEATVAKVARNLSAFGKVRSAPEGVSEHQAAAAQVVLSREIAILGGGPGTGKTYTAAKIIGQAIATYGVDKVAVGCPTGKAAVRITESLNDAGIKLVARTWHSILKVSEMSETGGWSFEHNEGNRLPYQFLVGDESSMLDATLMSCILKAIPTGCRLLLVGDVQQLPPVGHGAPLRDMINAKLPYAELTEVRRNSGHIVQTCQHIRKGERWSGVEKINIETGDNLKVLEVSNAEAQIQKMIDAIRATGSWGELDPVWDCQVIVPVNRKSPLARTKLNQVLQAEFNTNESIPGNPFRLDDKVVNTRNAQLDLIDEEGHKAFDEKGEPIRAYVANGEIGRVVKVEPRRLVIKLESPDRLVVVPRGKTKDEGDDDDGPNTGCSWDLAYAISAHKSQGSEWPVAIVMLDEYPGAMRLCDRAWLYTAISRAKKLCLMIGKKETADAMCRRTNIQYRKTFLKELIQ